MKYENLKVVSWCKIIWTDISSEIRSGSFCQKDNIHSFSLTNSNKHLIKFCVQIVERMYTGVKQNQKAVSSAHVSSSQRRESFVQDAEKYVFDRVGEHRKAQDDDDVGDGSMHKALLFLGVSSGRPVDGVRNRRLKRLSLTQLLLLPFYVRLNFLSTTEKLHLLVSS